jgi:hypothetical protein
VTRGSMPAVSATPRITARAASAKPTGAGGFAAELDRETKKSTPTRTTPSAKPAQVPERTTPVAGHSYLEVTAGPRNGMFINKSGNERDGQAFLIVERAGRTFHIYGTGEDREVFEVKAVPAPKAPAAAAPASPTTAVTTTTTPAPGAAAPAITPPVVATPAVPALPGLPGR